MKTIKQLLSFILLFVLSTGVDAQNPFGHKDTTKNTGRNVYGADDRKAATGWSYKDYTRATAVAVFKNQFQGNYLTGKSLGQNLLDLYPKASYVSSSVRFKDEPAFGFCSGFLIAPDILVTAGHCLDFNNYTKVEWVFDYTNDIQYKPGDRIYIPSKNRYKVKKILTRRLTNSDGRDYLVLQLDRKVTDREPFRYRTGSSVEKDDKVTLLGAPSGIPLKIVQNAKVTKTYSFQPYFSTNLDAFGGNSGGPVYNSGGFIEGILVRGPTKGYYVDQSCQCLKTSSYSESSATYRGVEVMRITDIPWDLLSSGIYSNIEYALETNNSSRLKKWIAYSWIFEEKTLADKEPLILLAAKAGNMNAVRSMVDAGASIYSKDKSGKTMMNYAMESSGSELLNFLLREGYDLSTKDGNGYSPVFLAIRANKPALLRSLIDNGANVNETDTWGSTPLHAAVNQYSSSMIEILLDNGADIFATNSSGWTPRKLAKKNKSKALKKYLKKEEKKRK